MAAVFLPVAGTPRCHRTSDSAAGLEPPMSAFGGNADIWLRATLLPSGISVTLRDQCDIQDPRLFRREQRPTPVSIIRAAPELGGISVTQNRHLSREKQSVL